MKNELGLIDKVMIIDEMLQKLGYDTTKMMVDEVLDIKNAIEKVVSKVKLPVKDYIHPLNA
jgi:hypothetical protein